MLGLVAVGLLIWALVLRLGPQRHAGRAQRRPAGTGERPEASRHRSDTATGTATEQPTRGADAHRGGGPGQGGSAALVAAGALVTGLAKELGATQEDVAATEKELEDTQKQADTAEKDAAAAKQKADDATDDAEKANAQVDQANAERDAAQAKAKIAADCGKAYLSAFGGLFGSGDIRGQAPAVRKDLEAITAAVQDGVRGDVGGRASRPPAEPGLGGFGEVADHARPGGDPAPAQPRRVEDAVRVGVANRTHGDVTAAALTSSAPTAPRR